MVNVATCASGWLMDLKDKVKKDVWNFQKILLWNLKNTEDRSLIKEFCVRNLVKHSIKTERTRNWDVVMLDQNIDLEDFVKLTTKNYSIITLECSSCQWRIQKSVMSSVLQDNQTWVCSIFPWTITVKKS